MTLIMKECIGRVKTDTLGRRQCCIYRGMIRVMHREEWANKASGKLTRAEKIGVSLCTDVVPAGTAHIAGVQG
jgi:hypothetical protein